MAAKPVTAKPKHPGGRPRIKFTQEQRDSVARLAAVGTRHDVISRILNIGVNTLKRHFGTELSMGLDEANAQVAGALFSKALAGDTSSLIWWEKTRGGKREITRHEHSGIDGAPIPLKDMSGYSDEQLDLLSQAAGLLAGSAGGDGDESEAAAR